MITDGDIRRMLEREDGINDLVAQDIMGGSPISMQANDLAAEATAIMRQEKISQVIVLDGQSYIGMVHIHDLNREGIL